VSPVRASLWKALGVGIGACAIGPTALGGCAADAAARPSPASVAVGRYGRPPGMPIGGGAADAAVEPPEPPPPEIVAEHDSEAPVVAATAAGAPCTGCVELNVDVDDINQRDEFALDVGGVRVTKVTWTIRVNFNSDQLAVQPFIDGKYGKYTSLHVNTFPLGAPVAVEQVYEGKAREIGLVVGSSGAWTGNQTMSVFLDSVRVEGKPGFEKTFAGGAEGLAPRTHQHRAKLVVHAEAPADPQERVRGEDAAGSSDSGERGSDRRPSP
jgi:hypothetical protein